MMEIHKIDKSLSELEEKKPVFKDKPPKDPHVLSLKESWQQLPKGKLAAYLAVILSLVTASIVYNIVKYRQANQPFIMGIPESPEELSLEFYNLCSDIEEYKDEFGNYPESIQDMLFSNHLMYRRFPDNSFRLVYDDGRTNLIFDSKQDQDLIR